MKNPLKKLSASKQDRREALEQDAAEKIQQAGSQPPPEASTASWAHPGPERAAPAAAPASSGTAQGGRRLTVQERMAARPPA